MLYYSSTKMLSHSTALSHNINNSSWIIGSAKWEFLNREDRHRDSTPSKVIYKLYLYIPHRIPVRKPYSQWTVNTIFTSFVVKSIALIRHLFRFWPLGEPSPSLSISVADGWGLSCIEHQIEWDISLNTRISSLL